MDTIPLTDNHIHIDPINGEGPIEIANKFHRAGGSCMIIPNKPTWTVNNDCSFQESMELVVENVNEINKSTLVKAFAVVGAHPAELSRRLKSGMDIKKAELLMRNALKNAQKLVLEDKAVAIGEIGRPHYDVSVEELKVHNRIIIYAMELAKDAKCPIQLHTETAGPKQFLEFAEMADTVGIPRNRIIKHFSGPCVLEEENHGLTPSLIATKNVIKEGLKKGNNFLMETDYLDDKTRPGAVLGPKTVPRRTKEFIRQGILSKEDAYKIHVDNIENTYRIDLNL
ncbi:MAG: TatD family hydrolase [Methanobacterium sp.]|nr:TatD family hydrolase [Methanobacterium sp.]